MTTILSIETSCDETSIAVIKADGDFETASFEVLESITLSQIPIHVAYGGVYPTLARREHQKNLPEILKTIFERLPEVFEKSPNSLSEEKKLLLQEILIREPEMAELLIPILEQFQLIAPIKIAVTIGPGLEPALWVGLNCAKALSSAWEADLIPTNHMKGHLVSVLIKEQKQSRVVSHGSIEKPKTKDSPSTSLRTSLLTTSLKFPVLGLLVSGGHTELVFAKSWTEETKIGKTRDDAVGEAFDKVARLLGLPYPGGPMISALAESSRLASSQRPVTSRYVFPRPMLNSPDYDFSYAGLKTSVRYKIDEIKKENDGLIPENIKKEIALEFENSAIEPLLAKTKKAILEFKPMTLIVAGGVSANKYLKSEITKMAEEFPDLQILFPEKDLTGDNALMIGIAGYFAYLEGKFFSYDDTSHLKADGNLSL